MIGRRHPLVLTGPSRLALAEGCWGVALLLFAAPLLQTLAVEPVDRRVIKVARILGIRQLLQGVMTVRRPTRRTLQVGATVDALHAATMVAGAVANVAPRRFTMASAAVAGGFTVAGVAQSRRPALLERLRAGLTHDRNSTAPKLPGRLFARRTVSA